jgi:hypothetical protein
MRILPCQVCQQIRRFKPRSRGDYIACVHTMKDASVAGQVEILVPDEESQGDALALADLSYDPPYPDIIFFKIRCAACGALYRLFIDWYHGRGQCLCLRRS